MTGDSEGAKGLHGLDDTDLRILRSLQSNPRKPVSKVAREVGLTDNAIRYRLKRMQAAGIIRGFVMVVDPKVHAKPALGMLLAKASDPEAAQHALHDIADVVGIYHCEGKYNLCLIVRARDEHHVEEMCQEIQRLRVADDPECLLIRHIYRASSATIPETAARER
jgi:DNA-binding Lrp family transcriptional regulator